MIIKTHNNRIVKLANTFQTEGKYTEYSNQQNSKFYTNIRQSGLTDSVSHSNAEEETVLLGMPYLFNLNGCGIIAA